MVLTTLAGAETEASRMVDWVPAKESQLKT